LPYDPAKDIQSYVKSLSKSRKCLLTGKRAQEYFRNLADMFGFNLHETYSIKKMRNLPKSKVSISDVISETRAEKYE